MNPHNLLNILVTHLSPKLSECYLNAFSSDLAFVFHIKTIEQGSYLVLSQYFAQVYRAGNELGVVDWGVVVIVDIVDQFLDLSFGYLHFGFLNRFF